MYLYSSANLKRQSRTHILEEKGLIDPGVLFVAHASEPFNFTDLVAPLSFRITCPQVKTGVNKISVCAGNQRALAKRQQQERLTQRGMHNQPLDLRRRLVQNPVEVPVSGLEELPRWAQVRSRYTLLMALFLIIQATVAVEML